MSWVVLISSGDEDTWDEEGVEPLIGHDGTLILWHPNGDAPSKISETEGVYAPGMWMKVTRG